MELIKPNKVYFNYNTGYDELYIKNTKTSLFEKIGNNGIIVETLNKILIFLGMISNNGKTARQYGSDELTLVSYNGKDKYIFSINNFLVKIQSIEKDFDVQQSLDQIMWSFKHPNQFVRPFFFICKRDDGLKIDEAWNIHHERYVENELFLFYDKNVLSFDKGSDINISKNHLITGYECGKYFINKSPTEQNEPTCLTNYNKLFMLIKFSKQMISSLKYINCDLGKLHGNVCSKKILAIEYENKTLFNNCDTKYKLFECSGNYEFKQNFADVDIVMDDRLNTYYRPQNKCSLLFDLQCLSMQIFSLLLLNRDYDANEVQPIVNDENMRKISDALNKISNDTIGITENGKKCIDRFLMLLTLLKEIPNIEYSIYSKKTFTFTYGVEKFEISKRKNLFEKLEILIKRI